MNIKKFLDNLRLIKYVDLKQDRDLYLRLLTYLKPYKKRFIISTVAAIPGSAIQGLTAYAVGPLLDYILTTQNYTVLVWIPVAIIVVQIIQGVLAYIMSYYSSYVGTSITCDLRTELFDKLIQQDTNYFNRHRPGDLVLRFSNDPVRLQQAIVTNLQDFTLQFFSLLFLTIVLLTRNWMYALVSIGVIALVGIPLSIISTRIRKLDHQTQEANARLLNVFYDVLQGNRIIKVYNLFGFEKNRYRLAMDKFFNVSMRIVKTNQLLSPITQFIAAVGVSLVLWAGAYQLMLGLMTPGELTSFIVALLLMYKPAKTVTGVLGKIQRILAPAERVFEKLDEPLEIAESENPVDVGPFELMQFKDVWFEYAADNPIIRGVNLSFTRGERIALVGYSGGGKSTLADLICGFINPTQGHILFNGIDLKDARRESLYEQIAVVTQTPFLVDGTMRENIALGRLDATEEEIREAARAADILDYIDSTPDGMDSWVGDRGSLLSGGQKQRVTIARAFLKNAPLLIMDEATSSLDNEAEQQVQRSLEKLQAGKTVIVIAHRMSTVMFADRILVMEAGRLVEEGSHQELVAKGGTYSRLYSLQFQDGAVV